MIKLTMSIITIAIAISGIPICHKYFKRSPFYFVVSRK